MPKNPDKVKGNSGPCFKCGTIVTCNEISYNNEAKLQWQVNGQAHYDKDGNCKGSSNQTTQAPPIEVSQKVKLEDIKLDKNVLDEVLNVTKSSSQFLKAIEYGVWLELGETNPAHVGNYVKIIANKLLNVPDLAKILEEVRINE